MDERPLAPAAAHYRELALADRRGRAAVRRVTGARPVEEAVAQHDPLESLGAQHLVLEVLDRGVDRRGLCPERVVLVVDPVLARRVGERDALGDDASRAARAGGGEQVAGALGAQAVGGLELRLHLARIQVLGDRRELMHDDLGRGRRHRGGERVGVEHVNHDRRRAGRT